MVCDPCRARDHVCSSVLKLGWALYKGGPSSQNKIKYHASEARSMRVMSSQMMLELLKYMLLQVAPEHTSLALKVS